MSENILYHTHFFQEEWVSAVTRSVAILELLQVTAGDWRQLSSGRAFFSSIFFKKSLCDPCPLNFKTSLVAGSEAESIPPPFPPASSLPVFVIRPSVTSPLSFFLLVSTCFIHQFLQHPSGLCWDVLRDWCMWAINCIYYIRCMKHARERREPDYLGASGFFQPIII